MNVSKPEQPEELSYEGYVLTAMRIVNAIPHVCAAKPGIVTIHDIPMGLPHSAFRSEATNIRHKVCKAKPVLKATREIREIPAPLVLKATKVILVPLVLKATRVIRATKVIRVIKVTRVPALPTVVFGHLARLIV